MRSQKIRLELNKEERTLTARHAGTARYAYNWALDKSYEQTKKRLSALDLHKDWVIYKNETATWAKEVG